MTRFFFIIMMLWMLHSEAVTVASLSNDAETNHHDHTKNQREYSGTKILNEMNKLHGRRTQEGRNKLQTHNSDGRSGYYYLPQGYNEGGAKPCLVVFHGTNAGGRVMVNKFESLAEQHNFIIVAPESGEYMDYLTWEAGYEPGTVTEDYTHALNCLQEVRNLPGVSLDEDHVLAAGVSGGAAFAPYLATNEEVFTHFASLHGAVITGVLGSRMIPSWFSTGIDDPYRPPASVVSYKDDMEDLGYDVVYHEYPGGHGVSEAEKRELISWWLTYTSPSTERSPTQEQVDFPQKKILPDDSSKDQLGAPSESDRGGLDRRLHRFTGREMI